MNKSKRFDRALFEENDKNCRNKVREILKSTKYALQDNPKKMGVDLFAFRNGECFANIEVERKKVWKGPVFSYKDVNLPARKEKYAKMDLPTIFVMFNEDFSSYLTIKDVDVLSSPLEEVHNKYVMAGELFFKIPLEKVKFDQLEEILDETYKKFKKR